MTVSALVVVISIALLVVFCVLLAREEAKGKRLVLTGIRERLDELVLALWRLLERFSVWTGVGTLRMIGHYIIHRFLGVCLYVIEQCQTQLSQLQRRNKTVVKSIQSEKRSTHLDSIAAHKEATTLSDSEKTALRDKHLAG